MEITIWLVVFPLMSAFLLGLIATLGFEKINSFLKIFAVLWAAVLIIFFTRSGELPLIYSTGGWAPDFAINLLVDNLSFIFVLINGLFSLLILGYSLLDIEGDIEKKSLFYVFFLISLASVNGMILTSDLFNLFVFFEIMAISSYSLVAASEGKFTSEAAFKYMVVGFLSSVFLLSGVILAYVATGSLNMAVVAQNLQELPGHTTSFIFIFFFLSLAMKFTYIPFHFWLADIYQASTITYNVLSSALIMNANLFAFIRLTYNVFGREILNFSVRPVLLSAAVITVLLGHTLAYRQNNLKRLLAYSGVAQVGYIMLGVFLFTPEGLSGGTFHMINNGLLKLGMFFIANIFFLFRGSQKILHFKGISFKFPVLGAIFTIFCLGLVGLPPFNAFASKVVILEALIAENLWPLALILPVGSFMALSYYLKIIKIIYSPGRIAQKTVDIDDFNYYLPLVGAVIVGVILLGLYPNVIYSNLLTAAEQISEQGPYLIYDIIEVTG